GRWSHEPLDGRGPANRGPAPHDGHRGRTRCGHLRAGSSPRLSVPRRPTDRPGGRRPGRAGGRLLHARRALRIGEEHPVVAHRGAGATASGDARGWWAESVRPVRGWPGRIPPPDGWVRLPRSEERRVGKEWRLSLALADQEE